MVDLLGTSSPRLLPPSDPSVVLPQDKDWNGSVVGVYVRNSSPLSVGNYRSFFQSEDFAAYVCSLGYAIKVYDEQGKSGGRLHNRKKAAAMLRDLESGAIDGISAVELSRLGRDEYGFDAATIAQKIRRHGDGLLVTHGKVWNLKNKWDFRQYNDQMKYAGYERTDIRDRFFEGLWVAARERKDEPFQRGKVTLGYIRVPILDADGRVVMNRRGVVLHTWRKDVGEIDGTPVADILARVRAALHAHPTPSEVAAALNREAVPSPWSGMSRYPWRTSVLRKMIRNPVYWGDVYPLVRPDTPLGEVWDAFEGDPRNVVHHKPDLAYWTKAEARAWQEKFLDAPRITTRYRKHNHLLLGVLACRTCGRPLGRGGAFTRPDGVTRIRYLCPGAHFSHEACTSPQWLDEAAAFKALKEMLPEFMAAASTPDEIADRAEAIASPEEDAPLTTQLELLESRIAQFNDTWVRPGRTTPPEIVDQMYQLDDERRALLEKIERQDVRRVLTDQQKEAIETIRNNPDILFDDEAMTPTRIAAIYRALVKNVVIDHNGRPGSARRFFVRPGAWEVCASKGSSPAWWEAYLHTDAGRVRAA